MIEKFEVGLVVLYLGGSLGIRGLVVGLVLKRSGFVVFWVFIVELGIFRVSIFG